MDAAEQSGGNGQQGMRQFGILVHSEHSIPSEVKISFIITHKEIM